MYKTNLSYTVTEDGSLADIKASGNNELFNNETVSSFKRANENITWKPAEKDGKPVRYRMRIPLTMSFE
ncbi:energy transducer TonB [Chryseobacterium ginsenosidimutans]|uniref:energy transducer TonB n=1 Tax=Chryseobacterium ginsenosidimutans TaxID=687846 RepID=UPI00216A9DB5|nr:energy transducer TonB [Chryseobacterium ginsenosidimutans]